MPTQDKPQWVVEVIVWHGASFGHAITADITTPGRLPGTHLELGRWRGIGIPREVMDKARAKLDAIFTEHLIHRYGVALELPTDFGEEVGPF